VYDDGSASSSISREKACASERVACIEVEYEEGEGL
jgi:hypothetical protein